MPSSPESATELHVDLVKNEWLAGYQERMERVRPDDVRAKWNGSYAFATEPHTDEDCPFRESERLPLKPTREHS